MEEITPRDDAWDTALYTIAKEGSITSTEIARQTDISTKTANRVLKSMEAMGYVERETNRHHTFYPSDRLELVCAFMSE
ncbi:MarR family transcriptional regulator [Natronolimnobius baerhuensis]|uniref:HTH marR-type domain-containing protein n=1 Tax=Natronolimnobius baerhuensis TaxID=253108 RepID=A0A202E9Y4_9EURY|nr:helix-turn-helix domain-containing protein [Natronolimnobius baerhuensis]OVE85103.1 hypothetical protein B2G88_12210 [Natronolimnobius baerhuensis]